MVSPYLDHELTAEERSGFEAHLKGCPACTARLADYQGLHASFSGAAPETAPAWFFARVRARIAERGGPRILVPLLVRFAEAVVVILMLTIGIATGGFLVSGGQRSGDFAASLSLDLFDPAPQDSVGGLYLAMTEADHGN
jgi:anti-sigma factor RsiW